jgi:hypothetical protein
MLLNFKVQNRKSWRDVAKQLEQESDADKLCALTEELIEAIDAQTGLAPKKRPQTVRLNSKSAKRSDS